MGRISIELPERFAFSTEIALLSMHINLGGHLDNAQLLSLVGEARLRFWESLGYAAMNLDGVIGMVSDAAVQYTSEAFPGETMVIEKSVRDFNKYGFDLVWRVSDQASGREVARGKTGVLCFDPKARKVVPIPERLLNQLHTHSRAA